MGTLRAMNRVFSTGMFEGDDMSRTWEAKELKAMSITVNSYTPKDHKPVGPGGLPKTRPLCGAQRTIMVNSLNGC